MIKLCVFDLDGTLLDTLDTVTAHVNLALREEGIPPITSFECSSLLGKSISDMFVEILSARGLFDKSRLQSLFRAYARAASSDPIGQTKPFPGVRELLNRLQERGIAAAVLSNKRDESAKMLTYHFFPTVRYTQGFVEGEQRKPSPEPLWRLLSHLECERDEVLYIGDTEVDVETGKNAGVKTLAVSWGYRTEAALRGAGAQEVLSLPEEILAHLDEL